MSDCSTLLWWSVASAAGSCLLLGDLVVVPLAERDEGVECSGLTWGEAVDVVGFEVGGSVFWAPGTVAHLGGALVAVTG